MLRRPCRLLLHKRIPRTLSSPGEKQTGIHLCDDQRRLELKTGKPNPLKVLALLQNNVPDEFLEGHIAESAAHTSGPREVILSEYLIGGAEQ